MPLTEAALAHTAELQALGFSLHAATGATWHGPDTGTTRAVLTTHHLTHTIQTTRAVLTTHKIPCEDERHESTTATEIRLRVEAVNRWYVHDWNTLDNKIRSSIVEGVSVFLSLFDVPAVARVLCPPAPQARRFQNTAESRPADTEGHIQPGLAATALKGVDLPPLDALIDRGKVLALNMPAGTNPALARAIGVMLKNAWLQSAPATAGTDESRARSLLPAGRVYLRRISSVRQWSARTTRAATKKPLPSPGSAA